MKILSILFAGALVFAVLPATAQAFSLFGYDSNIITAQAATTTGAINKCRVGRVYNSTKKTFEYAAVSKGYSGVVHYVPCAKAGRDPVSLTKATTGLKFHNPVAGKVVAKKVNRQHEGVTIGKHRSPVMHFVKTDNSFHKNHGLRFIAADYGLHRQAHLGLVSQDIGYHHSPRMTVLTIVD